MSIVPVILLLVCLVGWGLLKFVEWSDRVDAEAAAAVEQAQAEAVAEARAEWEAQQMHMRQVAAEPRRSARPSDSVFGPDDDEDW